MKYLLMLILCFTPFLYASSVLDAITLQGNVENTTQFYFKTPADKHPNNNTLTANLELSYEVDALSMKAKVKAQQDFYDLYEQSEKNKRSFIRLDELYTTYDFENDQLFVGKNIRFWGALEVRNITDAFNGNELRGDVFTKDKLGAWNFAYTHYIENGELSVIVKLYEQSRKMSAYPYVYYYFPQTVPTDLGNLPLSYDSKLITEKKDTRPSIYLKYSGSTDSEYPLDYAVIFENGYDSQRYYTTTPTTDFSSVVSSENAYLVNKLSTYNTLVLGATLCKFEALYTDVINDAEVSDYYHLAFGIEHTLSQVYDEADLGLLVEYYYYDILDKEKRSDLELFETFQNDLFVGFRYTFNNIDDANIVAGTVVDLDYSEEVYYFEYESRLGDSFKMNFDYRYIDPSKDTNTAFHLMGQHQRVSFKFGYYF